MYAFYGNGLKKKPFTYGLGRLKCDGLVANVGCLGGGRKSL